MGEDEKTQDNPQGMPLPPLPPGISLPLPPPPPPPVEEVSFGRRFRDFRQHRRNACRR